MVSTNTHARRRKVGIEPLAIDLTPITSQPYSEAESEKISAFFQRKKAENDKRPEIIALREAVARRQKKH